MKLSDAEVRNLRIICFLNTILFVTTLCFVIHNLYRYIIKLKIFRPLIVLFYVFLLLSMIFRLIEFAMFMTEPSSSYWPLNKITVLMTGIALFFMVCVGFVLMLSMHQLSVTIRVITFTIKTTEQMKTRIELVRIGSIIWVILFGVYQVSVFIIYYTTEDNEIWKLFTLGVGVQMIFMSIVYVVVILILNKEMKKLSGNSSAEITSINW